MARRHRSYGRRAPPRFENGPFRQAGHPPRGGGGGELQLVEDIPAAVIDSANRHRPPPLPATNCEDERFSHRPRGVGHPANAVFVTQVASRFNERRTSLRRKEKERRTKKEQKRDKKEKGKKEKKNALAWVCNKGRSELPVADRPGQVFL